MNSRVGEIVETANQQSDPSQVQISAEHYWSKQVATVVEKLDEQVAGGWKQLYVDEVGNFLIHSRSRSHSHFRLSDTWPIYPSPTRSRYSTHVVDLVTVGHSSVVDSYSHPMNE